MSNEPLIYHLFAGSDYYPSGGMYDYRGSFHKQTEAEAAGATGDDAGTYDWAHVAVWDKGTFRVVSEYGPEMQDGRRVRVWRPVKTKKD